MTTVDEVRDALARISWECVRDDFISKPVGRKRLVEVIASLSVPGNADEEKKLAAIPAARAVVVDELEHRLKLLQPVGRDETEVKVALDPLAEYMAAWHISKIYGTDREKWSEFLAETDRILLRSSAEQVRGFLLAVRDCAALEGELRDWLELELTKRAKYDLRAQIESRRVRGLRFNLRRLKQGGSFEKMAAIRDIVLGAYLDADAEAALAQIAKSGEWGVRSDALQALANLDAHSEAAQEALRQGLSDDDPAIRKIAIYSHAIAGPNRDRMASLLVPVADDSDPDVRKTVARNLGWIGGTVAENKVCRLAERDSDREVRLVAAMSWVELAPGPASLSSLANVIAAVDDLPSYDMLIYGRQLTACQASLECLVQRSTSPDAPVRFACMRILVEMESIPPQNVIEAVKARLKDGDTGVAVCAAVALMNWGVADDEVSTRLRESAKDGAPEFRADAAVLLSRRIDDPRDREELLTNALVEENGAVRFVVAAELLRRDPAHRRVAEALGEIAARTDAQKRYDLVHAMRSGSLKTVTGPTIENLLLKLIEDRNANVRDAVAEAILERKQEHLLEGLAKGRTSPDPKVRARAAAAFAYLKPTSEVELGPLRLLLKDDDFRVQEAAAQSYWTLTHTNTEILPVLSQLIQSNVSGARERAFRLLEEMARAGQSDAGLVALGLRDVDAFTRHTALKALIASGTIDDGFTARVIQLLGDSYEFVRLDAINYLMRAGVFTANVREKLADFAANEKNKYVKRAALEALGEVADPSPNELEILIEATRHPEDDVRRAAADSLGHTQVEANLVIPALAVLLEDADIFVTAWAGEAVRKVAKSSPDSYALLAQAASDSASSAIRGALLQVMDDLGDPPERTATIIADLLRDGDSKVRSLAAVLIGRSRAGDPAVLLELEKARSDSDSTVAAAALLAYERLVPAVAASTNIALALRENADLHARLSAAVVLATRDDFSALQIVRDALRGSDADARQIALTVLRELPDAAHLFRTDIEPLLAAGDTAIQASAARVLLRGPSSDLAVATLSDLLTKAVPVATVLRQAGSSAAAAVPGLRRAVELGDEEAIPVLCEVAAPDVAIDSLRGALSHTRSDVRAAAAAAAGEFDAVPEEITSRLRVLAHDSQRDVRIAARSSLARVRSRRRQSVVGRTGR